MSTFDIAEEVLERESRERQALALLLDGVLARADRMFVQRTKMGGTEAYLGSAELNWVSANIGLAQELPFLAQYIDEETGQMVIDAETIDLLTQRPIDWSRQQVLAQYIATTKNHKFPPLLVVITAPWVNDPGAPGWGADGRAVRTVTQFTPLENSRRVGLLEIGGSFNAFALDGQHRLIGIQGFINLVRTGQLEVKNKQNKSLNKLVLLEDLITEYGLDRADVQSRAEERVGVEFIPAVVAGETIDEARRRVKDIFTHVNMTAAPLNAGQIAQLDEGNGFAIVARRNAVSHELLRKKDGRADRVNFNSNTVASRATVLTTLQTLKEMATRYLGADGEYDHWLPSNRGGLPTRPSERALVQGTKVFAEFLTYMSKLPSYQELERGADTGTFRRLSSEVPPGKGHILFRPIGQIALAQAVGFLRFQRLPEMQLDDIFRKLEEYDEAEGFRMEDQSSLWYGVLYDPTRQRIVVAGRDLAARLLRYLVGGGLQDDAEREQLRANLAEARQTTPGMARNFDGREVPQAEIKLPGVL